MARIFLSYAREDAAKAGALARALDRAGHKVWWDQHVEGGTRFAREIATALKDAEAVIVLWSSSSIESEWVQDEAAEGHQTGRLIPVAIDSSPAPLGFRQIQSIDLSRWSGRGKVPSLASIETAIATLLKGDRLPRAKEAVRPRSLLARWQAIAAMGVLGILIVAGVLLHGSLDTFTRTPRQEAN